MSSLEEVPFAFLLTCSEGTLRDFAANCCNQVAELKKARREINEDLLLWEGRRRFAEKLIGSRAEIFDICKKDLRQAEFKFEPKREVRSRAAA
ncbi:MAG TPA: hypothetical protein VGT24_01720 [Candidatus Acidoferrales bacterium]|nr:hypothetical protein [Candidatus Acidoferrales bacterium]